MAEGLSQEPSYTMGYSEEFLQILDRRSAQSHAGYLLPHLKAGDRVLDFGCGPGTITVGLAKAVEPGEAHGVDMEESQVKLARAAARSGRAYERYVSCGRRDGAALRRRLLRCRPLPCCSDTRPGYTRCTLGGDEGPQAGRIGRLSRAVRIVVLPRTFHR